MRWLAQGIVVGVLVSVSGCTATPMCVPDGMPACECMPSDSRFCTADGGLQGLQACGNSGFWSACVAFMDAGPADRQSQRDTGGLPDFGQREF